MVSEPKFSWYDGGRLGFALAAGILLIPLSHQIFGGNAPCMVGSGCALTDQFAKLLPLYLSPAFLGVIAAFTLLVFTSLSQSATLARWLGLLTAVVAVGLQIRLAASDVFCSTCIAAAVFFVAGAWICWRKPFASFSSGSTLALLVGLCLPLTLTLFVPKQTRAIRQPTANQLGSVDRRELVEGRSSQVRVLVAFGSPMCPACRQELPEANRLANRLQAEFVYRFSPVKAGDRQEWSSAARLKEMVSRRYTEQWHAALSSPKMVLGSDEIILSREEVTEALRKTQLDEVIGKQIGLIQLPTLAICEPATPCREISLQELRELAR